MFAQLRWFGVVTVLAGASLLGTPDLSFAQRGGRGGGGGHVGGVGHVGGFGGGRVGGVGGGFRGGFVGGGFGYGLYGGYLGGYGPYYGGGYGYPGYSAYPYSSYYPYSAGSYSPYSTGTGYYYVSPSIAYSPTYATTAPAFTFAPGTTDDTGSTAVAQTDRPVNVTVVAPENAKLWFDDVPVQTTGKTREFQTPPLTPGHNYTYHVRAEWMQDGHQTAQTQTVVVTPGADTRIVFPSTSAVGAQGTIPDQNR
jgi:uncharacterized protein (TIGR03000 family)